MKTLRILSCALALLAGPVSLAPAQTCDTSGPDLMVGDLFGPMNYNPGTGATYDAFSVSTYSCNVGDTWLSWIAETNQHPVIAQNLFRLKTAEGAARFEQLGQGWLKHGFYALSDELCCTGCVVTDGTHLGVHCADPYSGFRNGEQAFLGPKWQVNAWTGEFAYPPANPSYSGPVARRLQVRLTELEASSETVLHFIEGQYVSSDEPAANRNNNCSYRRVNLNPNGTQYNLAVADSTQRGRPGIRAWRDTDPAVTEIDVQVPDEGLFIVAAQATDLGGGSWHYEYAVQNVNSDRSAMAFRIEIGSGANLSNIGFHDVDYHSGDGPGNVNFSGTDWPAAPSGAELRWATETYAENASANALRWGTLYNFRFDADSAPTSGAATIELFKPGSPTEISVNGLPVPSSNGCPGDVNADNVVDLADLAVLLTNFGTTTGGTLQMGDLNGDGAIDLTDLAILISRFGASCP